MIMWPIFKVFEVLNQLTFSKPVTFFCGENGSGKSTLLEALAIKKWIESRGWNKKL